MKLEIGELYILEEEPHSPHKMLIYPLRLSKSSRSYIALKYTDRVKYEGWRKVLVPFETTRAPKESFHPFDARAAIVELFSADVAEIMK